MVSQSPDSPFGRGQEVGLLDRLHKGVDESLRDGPGQPRRRQGAAHAERQQPLALGIVHGRAAHLQRADLGHAGLQLHLDLGLVARVVVAKLKGQSGTQGASTLTQQIVRNFLLPKERSVQRKVQEIALAIQLEKKIKKQRLIEIYANSLFLGNGSYGVGAAAVAGSALG